jgi:hypothetical protein
MNLPPSQRSVTVYGHEKRDVPGIFCGEKYWAWAVVLVRQKKVLTV